MKKSIHITLFIASVLLFMAGPVFAGNFDSPVFSVINMHIAGSLTIDGKAAAAGDEVALLDQNGDVVGLFVVENEGLYGDMNISGNFSASTEDEGAEEGEVLIIKVWQASTDTLYFGDRISITAPTERNSVYSPYPEPPLQFEGGSFYLLNIQVR